MENIQSQMKELFGNSCYAYSLAYLFRKSDDVKILTKLVLEGWYEGYIDDDGFVSNPTKFIKLISGESFKDVQHVTISSLNELPEGNWIVIYYYNKTHFVVANRNGVIFDPSGESNSVKYGKVASYRRFIK
jgi:hypothetical protein